MKRQSKNFFATIIGLQRCSIFVGFPKSYCVIPGTTGQQGFGGTELKTRHGSFVTCVGVRVNHNESIIKLFKVTPSEWAMKVTTYRSRHQPIFLFSETKDKSRADRKNPQQQLHHQNLPQSRWDDKVEVLSSYLMFIGVLLLLKKKKTHTHTKRETTYESCDIETNQTHERYRRKMQRRHNSRMQCIVTHWSKRCAEKMYSNKIQYVSAKV